MKYESVILAKVTFSYWGGDYDDVCMKINKNQEQLSAKNSKPSPPIRDILHAPGVADI